MLNEHQKAKLIEWAEWMEAHSYETRMPHGVRAVDKWSIAPITRAFPTTEQMEPSRKDFGLEG